MMTTLTMSAVLQATLLAAPVQTYEAAYNDHMENNRVLVVLVGANWCPACAQMKQSVMPQVQRQGGLDKVAFAYVDTDREGALASKIMTGSSIPQLVLYRKTAAGSWERQQLTGGQSTTSVVSFIARGVEASAAALASAEKGTASDNVATHN